MSCIFIFLVIDISYTIFSGCCWYQNLVHNKKKGGESSENNDLMTKITQKNPHTHTHELQKNPHKLSNWPYAEPKFTAISVLVFLFYTCTYWNNKNVYICFFPDELYPVKSFMKYVKHLRGNKCDQFFQRPSTKPNSIKWYDNMPMGHNTIGNIMPKLSEKAGLSLRYTNHSLSATSVNILDNVGNFASRHIMTVTGHKSEASLKTYSGYTIWWIH